MKKILFSIFLISIIAVTLSGCGQASSVNDKNAQTVHIVATDWKFTPDHVEVKPGTVKFEIENQSKRMHGFGIDELNIKETIPPGKTIEKVVTIDKPGTYPFKCTVVCGTLDQHKSMEGTLTVK